MIRFCTVSMMADETHHVCGCGRRTVVLFVVVLVVIVTPPCACQRNDQVYIYIQPKRSIVTIGYPTTVVKISCRSPPETSVTDSVQSMMITRTPIVYPGEDEQVDAPQQTAEVLVVLDSLQGNATIGDSIVNASATAEYVDETLTLTLLEATCFDARYTYTCNCQFLSSSNLASATFSVTAKQLRPRIFALPTDSGVRIACRNNDALGLNTDPSASGTWVMEYNDVGSWKPARDVKQAGVTEEDCFQFSRTIAVTVSFSALTRRCSRLYRCYIRTGSRQAVDEAAEASAHKGFKCYSGEEDTLPSPFLAVVTSLFLVCVLCTTASFGLKFSSETLEKKEDLFDRQASDKILAPMTPEQRHKFIQEKLDMMKKQEDRPAPAMRLLADILKAKAGEETSPLKRKAGEDTPTTQVSIKFANEKASSPESSSVISLESSTDSAAFSLAESDSDTGLPSVIIFTDPEESNTDMARYAGSNTPEESGISESGVWGRLAPPPQKVDSSGSASGN